MTKFSDRIGATTPPTQLQYSEMNDALRHSLWNVLFDALRDHIMLWYDPMKITFMDFFKEPIDQLPREDHCPQELHARFYRMNWYDVYNFTEFMLHNIERLTDSRLQSETLELSVNRILERELSAFRSINLNLVAISNEIEINAIRDATSAASGAGITAVSEHLDVALQLLGKKPEPDYRNSIKESISAVEALCKIIAGEKSGGLDKALSKLSQAIQIHQALRAGILNLYGYSSNEDGVRHAILESPNLGFAEAKFMLVACSAVANFIIDKSREAKLI